MSFLQAGPGDARVTQTPRQLIRTRQTVTLRCSPISEHLGVSWYQQSLSQGPQLLFQFYENAQRSEGDAPGRFSAQQFRDYCWELNMSILELTDSALCLCASSWEQPCRVTTSSKNQCTLCVWTPAWCWDFAPAQSQLGRAFLRHEYVLDELEAMRPDTLNRAMHVHFHVSLSNASITELTSLVPVPQLLPAHTLTVLQDAVQGPVLLSLLYRWERLFSSKIPHSCPDMDFGMDFFSCAAQEAELTEGGVTRSLRHKVAEKRRAVAWWCDPISDHRGLYWYRQTLGQGLELLISFEDEAKCVDNNYVNDDDNFSYFIKLFSNYKEYTQIDILATSPKS
ncbi:hypothetical protein HPG69_016419 [Diceros bicornis minor]|uniref:Immunoglobulin V-set domain-containing protein n=1 Tax=Diceros bicornis minor TaxID=77932 RepID=A0A7J7EFH5_DICBM|nr:hypothetical protein HPG69_016419 [Diceros bicornis minor]